MIPSRASSDPTHRTAKGRGNRPGGDAAAPAPAAPTRWLESRGDGLGSHPPAPRGWPRPVIRRIPAPLRAILVVAALLSLGWSYATGPLLGPDEPQHFNYAQRLSETGKRPSSVTGLHPDSTITSTVLTYFN